MPLHLVSLTCVIRFQGSVSINLTLREEPAAPDSEFEIRWWVLEQLADGMWSSDHVQLVTVASEAPSLGIPVILFIHSVTFI
jgi:hypothetical protein